MKIRHYYGNSFQIEINEKNTFFENLLVSQTQCCSVGDSNFLAQSISSYVGLSKSRFPEVEPFLISLPNKEYAIDYAQSLKTRFLNGERSIAEGGVNAIKKYVSALNHVGINDPSIIVDLERYFLEYLNENADKDFEDIKNPHTAACDYAIEVKKGRWVEAEHIICKNARAALKYAHQVLKARWPEAEDKILNSKPTENYHWVLIDYLESFVNERWVEAEPFIIQHPKFAYNYAKKYIKGRWPEAEPFIKQKPDCAYSYAIHVIKGRWEEAEEFIAQSSSLSYEYAKNIINGKLPEEMHNRIIIMAMQNPNDPYLKKYLHYKKYKKETAKSK